jgi:hypothetical protein
LKAIKQSSYERKLLEIWLAMRKEKHAENDLRSSIYYL